MRTDVPAGAYYIMAHRSAASVFGRDSSPLKAREGRAEGKLYHTNDKAEAEQLVADMTARLSTTNVSYTVEHNGEIG